jgi:hypothetical protein
MIDRPAQERQLLFVGQIKRHGVVGRYVWLSKQLGRRWQG